MGDRPCLNKNLDSKTFLSYYYLKEELVNFCRQEELQTAGGKIELTQRIAHYLDTGEKLMTKIQSRTSNRVGLITPDCLIENNFVCSEKHRAFFKEAIGKSFSFHVQFQKWLKENAGKTYQEAIEAYQDLLKSKNNSVKKIDRQFEYNTYIRDFFADNPGKSLEQAIICWKYKKSLQGHNRYEKQDLKALD